MISHKTLGHPATLFALAVVSFIIGLKGTMLIDDATHAQQAVAGVPGEIAATPAYGTTSSPSGPLVSGPIVSPDLLVGMWREEWGDVTAELWIHNTFVNGAPQVSKPGNWVVWGERYENGVLSFQARSGDSGWSRTYWVTYNTNNSSRMNLRVLRQQDNTYFDGYLNLAGGVPPSSLYGYYTSSPPEDVVGGVPGGVPGGAAGGVPEGDQEQEQAPPRRIRLGSSAALAKVVDRVDPTYPPLARQAGIQGTVMVQTVIDVDGYVLEARAVSGHPLLSEAAVEAVQQWVFETTYASGDPVEVETTIPITFKLSEAAPSAPPAAAVPAPAGLQAFVGTWTSHWADVTDTRGFTISIENGRAKVSRSGTWRAWDENFDGRVLSFRTSGGDANWSFVYYLEYAGPNRLKLRVHRDHDNEDFTGEFTR